MDLSPVRRVKAVSTVAKVTTYCIVDHMICIITEYDDHIVRYITRVIWQSDLHSLD